MPSRVSGRKRTQQTGLPVPDRAHGTRGAEELPRFRRETISIICAVLQRLCHDCQSGAATTFPTYCGKRWLSHLGGWKPVHSDQIIEEHRKTARILGSLNTGNRVLFVARQSGNPTVSISTWRFRRYTRQRMEREAATVLGHGTGATCRH